METAKKTQLWLLFLAAAAIQRSNLASLAAETVLAYLGPAMRPRQASNASISPVSRPGPYWLTEGRPGSRAWLPTPRSPLSRGRDRTSLPRAGHAAAPGFQRLGLAGLSIETVLAYLGPARRPRRATNASVSPVSRSRPY